MIATRQHAQTRKIALILLAVLLVLLALSLLTGCGSRAQDSVESEADEPDPDQLVLQKASDEDVAQLTLVPGTIRRRGFVVDDTLTGSDLGDIHFSIQVPSSYDGSEPYALYIHCPGRGGLYYQGIGANLDEDFVFVANAYVPDMIVVSPQLDDNGPLSAAKTILLTRWLLGAYDIDCGRVYLSGYSDGGETLSYVLGERADLYSRALMVAAQWDGAMESVVENRVPLRISIGESDECYTSQPANDAYKDLFLKYKAAGLTSSQIGNLLVLDVKPTGYFDDQLEDDPFGFWRQHNGAGVLFPHDPDIMGWLLRP